MLTDRQEHILDEFLHAPNDVFTMRDFLPLFTIGRTSLFRDLTTLVDKQLILAEGTSRNRSYRLNPQSDQYIQWDLSRPPYVRPEISYQHERLVNYQPNESYLLNESQRQQLATVGNIAGSTPIEIDKNYTRLITTLLIDLAHASSNLENVPISWLDTKTLLEFGENPEDLNETELQIVVNHKNAINYLTTHAQQLHLNARDLFDIHTLIADGLISENNAIGRLRQRVVKFSDSRYLPPDNPHQLKEAFEILCEKGCAIEDPYEQAFFTMTFLPYLQPFQDGNKRTSRLAMNIPLLKNHLAPFSFSDLRKRDYMFGLLAFYERGKHHFLADAFVNAYSKTAPRYAELLGYVQQGGMLGTLT